MPCNQSHMLKAARAERLWPRPPVWGAALGAAATALLLAYPFIFKESYSHHLMILILLYALMLIMPLVGWGMLSAARYPIVLYGPLRLPPILPHDLTLYAWLRDLHTDLAYLLFATFLAHFGAALFHGLIRRDGVFGSMASWR